MHQAPNLCPITRTKTSNQIKLDTHYEYKVNYKGLDYTFQFKSDRSWNDTELLKQNRHILLGLILNRKWIIDFKTVISQELIESVIRDYDYPKTPKEKIDYLFLELINKQNFEGDLYFIDLNECFERLYFKTVEEADFYLNTLHDQGFIYISQNIMGEYASQLNITYKGLIHSTQIQENGKNSDICFVAMSFDEEEKAIFNDAIKPACKQTGFEAKRIDEQHLDSDVTINDGIIAGIKQSKFCIADFTKHKNGVYFEAGYALGRGIKVIYTCHFDHWKDTHFDTNHFQFIIYKTHEELKDKLIDKIKAWIKD